MRTIIRIKYMTVLIGTLFVLCSEQLVYAGLDLGFTIPAGTMTIDGASTDWTGINPIYNDPQGDSNCGTGTDIKDIYFAQNSTYLYWRMDTWSGTYAYDLPDEGPTIRIQQQTGPLTAGDVEVRVLNNISGIYGNVWQYNGSSWGQVFYGPAYGWVSNIAEGKIPLALFSGAQFTKVYAYYYSGVEVYSCDSIEQNNDIVHLYVNGTGGPVIVSSGTSVNLTIEITGDYSGKLKDYWVSGSTPYGTYWLTPSLTWVKSAAPISVGQYKLTDLPVTSILNSTLPAGLYQFVCLLDEKPNGLLDDMSNGSWGMVYITP